MTLVVTHPLLSKGKGSCITLLNQQFYASHRYSIIFLIGAIQEVLENVG